MNTVSLVELGADPHALHAHLLDEVQSLKRHSVTLGIGLLVSRESGAWRKVSGMGQSFNSYCADFLDLPDRTRARFENIAKTYWKQLQVSREQLVEYDPTKLDYLSSVVTEDNVETVLSDAAAYTISELKKLKAEGRYEGIDVPIQPDDPPELSTAVCPQCGHEIIL